MIRPQQLPKSINRLTTSRKRLSPYMAEGRKPQPQISDEDRQRMGESLERTAQQREQGFRLEPEQARSRMSLQSEGTRLPQPLRAPAHERVGLPSGPILRGPEPTQAAPTRYTTGGPTSREASQLSREQFRTGGGYFSETAPTAPMEILSPQAPEAQFMEPGMQELITQSQPAFAGLEPRPELSLVDQEWEAKTAGKRQRRSDEEVAAWQAEQDRKAQEAQQQQPGGGSGDVQVGAAPGALTFQAPDAEPTEPTTEDQRGLAMDPVTGEVVETKLSGSDYDAYVRGEGAEYDYVQNAYSSFQKMQEARTQEEYEFWLNQHNQHMSYVPEGMRQSVNDRVREFRVRDLYVKGGNEADLNGVPTSWEMDADGDNSFYIGLNNIDPSSPEWWRDMGAGSEQEGREMLGGLLGVSPENSIESLRRIGAGLMIDQYARRSGDMTVVEDQPFRGFLEELVGGQGWKLDEDGEFRSRDGEPTGWTMKSIYNAYHDQGLDGIAGEEGKERTTGLGGVQDPELGLAARSAVERQDEPGRAPSGREGELSEEAAKEDGDRKTTEEWFEEIMGLRTPIDAEEQVQAIRQQSAYDKALALRAQMDAASRGGLSPESTTGLTAQTAQAYDVNAQSLAAQERARADIANLQSEMGLINQALNRAMFDEANAISKEERQAARDLQVRLQTMQQAHEKRMYDIQSSVGWGDVAGAFLPALGTAVGSVVLPGIGTALGGLLGGLGGAGAKAAGGGGGGGGYSLGVPRLQMDNSLYKTGSLWGGGK